MPVQARLLERQGTGSQRRSEAADERKKAPKTGAFFRRIQIACQLYFSQVHILNLAATNSHLG